MAMMQTPTADAEGNLEPEGAVRLLHAGPVHLIGVGGVGMSGIARILRRRGVTVSGSDAKASATLDELAGLGVTVQVGHRREHVGDAAVLVVSSAVRETNPELVAARESGLPVLHRSQALAALMHGRRAVAVAGTHGKTTTTSMVTVTLRACGLDPSFAIGGELTDSGLSAQEGTGDVFVAEADESDASFLRYRPMVAIITNVEADHLDHYGTLEAVEAAFDAFCDRIVPGGVLVTCFDDPGAAAVAARVEERRGGQISVVRYGFGDGADIRLTSADPRPPGGASAFLHRAGVDIPLALAVPGRHNLLNAAAAWATAVWLGVDPAAAAAGLSTFAGARRRFELKGTAGGIEVRDDYSHHPTEVRAALSAARAVVGSGRVIAVFQPHLFSRTRFFAAEFADALGLADVAVVLDVYGAREDPDPAVTGRLISDKVSLPSQDVVFAPDAAAALEAVSSRAVPGDLVLTIGAGDVTLLGPRLVRAFGGSPTAAQISSASSTAAEPR
jgi:UDP-N-acetylmuramate--alanine ligase